MKHTKTLSNMKDEGRPRRSRGAEVDSLMKELDLQDKFLDVSLVIHVGARMTEPERGSKGALAPQNLDWAGMKCLSMIQMSHVSGNLSR